MNKTQTRHILGILALALAAPLDSVANAAIIKWDAGADDDNWSSPVNWDANAVVGATDVASFGLAGTVTVPGIATVRLVQPETVGGLIFENPVGKFQLLNLGGFELQVHGPMLVNVNGTAETLAGMTNGSLTFGAAGTTDDFSVGRNVSGNQSNVATLDLSGLQQFDATVDEILVGVSQSGAARGTLRLAGNNEIHARSILIGHAYEGFNGQVPSRLELGRTNVIIADEFVVGGRSATGNVVIAAGGTLQLGDDANRVDLSIGRAQFAANVFLPSSMDLRNAAEVHLRLSNLTVGERVDSQGGEMLSGSLWGSAAGTVTIGSPEQRGNVFIAHGVNSFSTQGAVDLGGMDQLTAHLDQLSVGVADFSTALGSLKLPKENVIDAKSVTVGLSNFHESLGPSVLHLGTNSVLRTNELTVGRDLGSGLLQIASGGTFQLGTADAPTRLVVGRITIPANTREMSTIDLRGARSDLFLGDVIIGERTNVGGPEPLTGVVYGGSSGQVVLGSPDKTVNLTVGRGFNGFVANGTLDLGGLDTMTAHLQRLSIGVGERGTALGTVILPKQTTMDVDQIIVGTSDFHDSGGTSVLKLGQSAVIRAQELQVGIGLQNGRVETTAGATLQLGAEDSPMNLVIGRSAVGGNVTHNSTVDLRSSHADLYLGDMLVGERQATPGGESITGTLFGGSSGSVRIGTPDDRADVVIGHGVQSFNAFGVVDFSSMDSLDAHLNQLLIGTSQNGTGYGTMRLPRESRIDAQSIVLGRSAIDDSSVLVDGLYLGESTVLMGDSMLIGGTSSRGLVTVPSGGELTIGSPEKPMHLAIGQSVVSANLTTSGILDAANGSLRAYLGTLILGQKPVGAGQAQGTFLAGADAEIHAERIVLADGPGSGTLQFGGGLLTANEVLRGAGAATFDWGAGTLEVERWGSPLQRLNLVNLGEGNLAPGADVGATEIFGDYRQGASASMSLDITSLAQFDHVTVHGAAQLAGTLFVQLAEGLPLTQGDRFPFLSFDSRNGAFAALAVSGLPSGFSLETLYDDVAHQAVLVVAGMPGDTNADGQVNLVDLNTIRNNFGAVGEQLVGDLDHDGAIGLSDLNSVRNNFGAVASVPEPAAWLLTSICAGVLCAISIISRHRQHVCNLIQVRS